MANKPSIPCRKSGCKNFIPPGGGALCVDHGRERHRIANANRDKGIAAMYGHRWAKASKAYLAEHPFCVKCNGFAEHTDHIDSHRGDVNSFWNEDNWQALCASCHGKKTRIEMSQQREVDSVDGGSGKGARLIVVCGPPGSGKTTYIRERLQYGDVVIDMDRIWMCFTGLGWYVKPPGLFRFIRGVYLQAVATLPHGLRAVSTLPHGLRAVATLPHGLRVWVVMGGARRGDRQEMVNKYNAEIIMLDVSANECKRRIGEDDRRRESAVQWDALVDDWWRRYQV